MFFGTLFLSHWAIAALGCSNSWQWRFIGIPLKNPLPQQDVVFWQLQMFRRFSKTKWQKWSILRCPGEGLPGLLGGYADADEVVVMWGVEPEKLISDLGVFFLGGSLFINNSDESLNRLCHWEDETSYEHGTFFFLWGGVRGAMLSPRQGEHCRCISGGCSRESWGVALKFLHHLMLSWDVKKSMVIQWVSSEKNTKKTTWRCFKDKISHPRAIFFPKESSHIHFGWGWMKPTRIQQDGTKAPEISTISNIPYPTVMCIHVCFVSRMKRALRRGFWMAWTFHESRWTFGVLFFLGEGHSQFP